MVRREEDCDFLSHYLETISGKAEYPCTKINGHVKFGFYKRGSHEVIPCEDCLLQPKFYSNIVSYAEKFCDKYKLEPYNEEDGKGLIRYLYIRHGYRTNQIMVCLVITKNSFKYEKEFVQSTRRKNVW